MPGTSPKKILLLSPYDAMSHAYWRRGLVDHLPGYEFHSVTLPPRYFSWRFRGNSLTLAHDTRVTGTRFDLMIATSMTDLAGIRGMRPQLAGVPAMLYFHENQFAWPAPDPPHQPDRQLTSLYSAISADKLVFNSAFNRSTFLEGAAGFLSRMPDHVPAGVVEALSAKSVVLPVPIEPAGPAPVKSARFTIVWNHRWEADKGVSELLEILGALPRDADCCIHLLGQQFRRIPADMNKAVDLLERQGRLGECGFADRDRYVALLAESHLVLSTARHEFQGIAVLEAVARGCLPLVPDRLVYPALFDAEFRYSNPNDAADRIAKRIQQFNEGELPRAPDVTRFEWPRQVPFWRETIDAMI